MARSDKRTFTLFAVFAAAIGFAAVNVVLWSVLRSARLDLTQEQLYSVSPGLTQLAEQLDEPVRLELYWTAEQGADSPELRSYAQRVREFLSEVCAESEGKLELVEVDPQPFSEQEETARASGLAPLNAGGVGRTLTLGLIVRSSTDRTEVIPYLAPDQEPFLEYELARRILAVGRDAKSKIGWLSTLPEMRGDPSKPEQAGEPLLTRQLKQLFDFVAVPKDAIEIPADLGVLLVIQPRKLSEGTLRAIDAWVRSGKPTIVFVDPWCESDPSAEKFGETGRGTDFDIDVMLASWGLQIPLDTSAGGHLVVADRGTSTRIQTTTPTGQVMDLDYPVWLSLRKENLSSDDPVTAPLSTVNIMSAGSIEVIAGASTTATTILATTKDSQLLQSLKLGYFGKADQLIRDFKGDDLARTLVARVRGPFQSMFADASGAYPKGDANLLVVSDADLLEDRTWVRASQNGIQTIADNGALVVNMIEQMGGSSALGGLRARGDFRRPFTRVERIRKDAEARFLKREEALRTDIQKTEFKIADLQRRKGDDVELAPGGVISLSPEQAAEMKSLETKVIDAKRALRDVQYSMREEIVQLGRRLMLLHVIVWPAAVAIILTTWSLLRWRRQRIRIAMGEQS